MFFLVASWYFDVAEMGFYALAISVQWVLVGIFGSGMSVAVVRLSVDHFGRGDAAGAAGITAIAAGLALLGTTLAAALSLLLLDLPATMGGMPLSATLAPLIALWAGGRAVLECLRASLLARENYRRVAQLTIASAVFGLSALAVVLLTGELDLRRLLIAHAVGQGASAVLAALVLVPLWRVGPNLALAQLKSLVRYARWPTLSEGTKLLQTHLGPVILVALSTAEQAGLYGLGRYPAYIFGVVGLSLYQYWLPQAALHGIDHRLRRFLRRQMRLGAVAAGCMLAGAFAVGPIMPLLGDNLAAGAPLIVPNTIDFIFVVLILPIEATYHGLHKPHLELVVRLCRLPVLLGLAYLLARSHGAEGMVWAQILSGAIALALSYMILRRNLGSQV